MARISYEGYEQYSLQLQALGRHFFKDEPLKKAVRAGADVLADEVRKEIDALPTVPFTYVGRRHTPASPDAIIFT